MYVRVLDDDGPLKIMTYHDMVTINKLSFYLHSPNIESLFGYKNIHTINTSPFVNNLVTLLLTPQSLLQWPVNILFHALINNKEHCDTAAIIMFTNSHNMTVIQSHVTD